MPDNIQQSPTAASSGPPCSLAFPVRLVTTAKLPDGKWIEEFWRDIVLPMPPFVGMLLNLDDDRDMREVTSIQWVEKTRRLHVELNTENLTGVLSITEDDLILAGWKKYGLWQ